MEPLPYELTQQMIQCFGRCFHYKDGMVAFLQGAGVPKDLAAKYREEPKFVWSRHLLSDLAGIPNGPLIQRQILTALCRLRNLPDNEVPDREAGLEALRTLKKLAVEHQLFAEEQQAAAAGRKSKGEAESVLVAERRERLEKLRLTFAGLVTSPNRQGAGFSLEDLLKELFALFEVEYRKSYRTDTQQIDGAFTLAPHRFLVEAKWRTDLPTEGEIGTFKHKVETKFDGTKGLFISVPGFRPEVAASFNTPKSVILLMDGQDLTHVLEGRVDLRDGLRSKIDKATDEGIVLTSIWGTR